jgi:hypothetical protein
VNKVQCRYCGRDVEVPKPPEITKEHLGRVAICISDGKVDFEGVIVDLTEDGYFVKFSRPGMWGMITSWHPHTNVRLVGGPNREPL